MTGQERPPVTTLSITWQSKEGNRTGSYMEWTLRDNMDEPLAVHRVPDDADQKKFNQAMLELTQEAYLYLQRDDS